MERNQHLIQDAAEHYAVYVMQRRSEQLGRAATSNSRTLWLGFVAYLSDAGLEVADFESGRYSKYKANADKQLPMFVDRLARRFPGATLDFENVEKEYRNRGLKGDFLVKVGGLPDPIAVSLKNYVGSGGISRPQVASGTFASFAQSFIFKRAGVGIWVDPRSEDATFSGSNVDTRTDVLRHLDLDGAIEPLAVLDRLQAEVRAEFLADDCEFYDQIRVRSAVERIAPEGIAAVLECMHVIGLSSVRAKFLERVGLDGKEEVLFFDSDRYVDSITNGQYHNLRERLNDEATRFTVGRHKQSLRFCFQHDGGDLLATDVPFTINTNGAWHRPAERYQGKQRIKDKGHWVDLRWGQRRPYKSKEIATSVNTYVNLARVGIFGD